MLSWRRGMETLTGAIGLAKQFAQRWGAGDRGVQVWQQGLDLVLDLPGP